MSQYQVTLILLAITSLGLLFTVLCFEVFASSAFSMALDAALANSKWFSQQILLETLVLVATICIALHLLGLAWVRIHHSTVNTVFRASLTALAIALPLVCFDSFHSERFTSSQRLGDTASYVESSSVFELAVEMNRPGEPSIKVYTVPFHKLYKGQILSHEHWDFRVKVLQKLNHASIGGPLAKLPLSGSRRERFLTASDGIARVEGLKMFHLPRHRSGGIGAKVQIIREKGAAPSEKTFLLYAGDSPEQSLPAQQILKETEAYKISLRAKHRKMDFSWCVTREGNSQLIHILDAETGQTLRSFHLGTEHQPVYQGYRFTAKRVSPENYDPQSILLEIEYHFIPEGIRITTIYFTVILTFIFLIGRFREILIHRSNAEGGST